MIGPNETAAYCSNPGCGKQFLTTYFARIAQRYPGIPPRTCGGCVTAVLRKVRERQTRKVALSDSDWTALCAAGLNNASRGLLNLVDTYRALPLPATTSALSVLPALPAFPIPSRYWLDATYSSEAYAARLHRRTLRIPDDQYGWLAEQSKLHSKGRARAPVAWPDIVPAIHALTLCYDNDTNGFAQRVNANRRGEWLTSAAKHFARHYNETQRSAELTQASDKDWLK